jgi:hypothetical protein
MSSSYGDWMSVPAATFVAGHDAPCIDERAAARGRSATEGGDEHAGVNRVLSVRGFSLSKTSVAHNATRDTHARGWRAGYATTFVAGDDVPLSGERAAARGRSATEGGDERAGAKSRHDFVPGSRTGSNGGNVDSLTATRPTETHVPTLATSVKFYRRR